MRNFPFIVFILILSFSLLTTIISKAQPLAFPGAVGFGKNVTGGRNGTVYHVTNLNDSGTGSFRDAVSQSNRIIVFDVSGYINLITAVSCKSNITIAGQTAPGEGIGFRGGKISCGSQSNIIIRHIRIRPGSEVASNEDVGINLVDAHDIIVDHCSIEFAPWNNIGGVSTNWQTKPVKNITFQNCLIANPTYQQFGAHIECPEGTWTWAYNIFANSHNRNPLDKIHDIFVNNVLYNCSAGYTTHTSTNFKHDIINNYFVMGPASTGTDNQWYQVDKNQSIYYSGNIKDNNLDGILNGNTTTPYWYQGPGTILTSPWSTETALIPTYSAATAFRYTSSFAGTFPYDEMDRLVISQVRTVGGGTTGYTAGTRGPNGSLYTSQTQTGLGNNGYGTILTGTKPTDTDNDGMPDFWEKALGLNINSNDAMTKRTDGYANIEVYLNWLAEPKCKTLQNNYIDLDISQYTGGFARVSPVHSVVSASNGTATLLSDGKTIRFTPTTNFYGLTSYKFKVTGSDGTSYTYTVGVVIEPSNITPCTPPTATITASGATTFCQGSNVTISANTGSNLSYAWKNGSTTISGATGSTYNTSTTGLYSVVVTNTTTNCSATSSVIIVTVNATPTATITSSGTVIPYQGNKVLNASTGTGYTYQWKLNNANITNATAATYTATVAGSYTVTVTANGCSATSTALVLTAETPPQKYIYNYDNSGDYNWSNTNSWTPKAVPRAMDTVIIRTGEVRIPDMIHTAPVYIEAAGTLRLLDTSTVNQIILQGGMLRAYTSSQGFVLNTNSIKVEQASTIQSGSLAGPIFTINGPISGSADLTKNGLATLRLTTASPNYKGNWIITEGKIQVRNGQALGLCGVIAKAPGRLDIEAATTIYSLKVEDGAGVDLDNTLTVNVAVLGSENMLTGSYTNATRASYIGGTSSLIVSSSILSASGATSFCQGGSVVLTAASSSSYQWKNNGTNLVTTASYTANATGNYSVLVKNSNACSLESAPQAVTVNPAPTATVTTTTSTTFCQGGSVVLSANTGTGLTYQWRNGTSNIASATGSSYTATTAGSYNVVVSSGNCSATSTNTTVTVNALPTATITAGGTTTFCQGGSVVLSANTGTSLTYQWRNGTSNIASATGATYTATTAGSYNVVVSSGNCSATSTNTTVTVNAPISVSVTPNGIQTLIPSQPITLTATTSATGVTYTWYNGTSVVGSNSATLSVTTAGNYSVQITNGTCQATSNTVSVVNANAPLVSMISPTNNGTAVAPTNILLEAQATDSDGSITKVEFYQNNVKVGEGTGTTSYQYTLTNVAQGAYTFYAVATDNSGLQTTSASVNFTVGVNQSPIVNTFTATYNQPTPGSSSTGSIDIAVNAQDPEGGALTVEIYDGTTLLTTLTNAPYTYTYNNPSVGTHDIVVKVKDSEGNTVTQTQSVTVIPASTPTRSANSLQVTYYPNPYREVITIEGEGSMDYIVQDMRGHEVERGTINSIGQVGANLPAAQYIVILQNQDKRSVIKIEKQ
ncbi:MAG: Ig-like domain-containing protein [Cytophagaceae bacterium]